MEIEREIREIKERNTRVEQNKAWEVSWIRRITIAFFTYIIAGIWLVIIEGNTPWLTAFVPTIGYVLSTVSLSFIRKWWMRR